MILAPCDSDIRNAFAAAADPGADTKIMTAIIPGIIHTRDAATARRLVCAPSEHRERWLAEAAVLLNTPGLVAMDRHAMNTAILPQTADLGEADHDRLADCHRRIGRYGFSFPQWRFISQSFNGPSLIERYGMTRLDRPTDIRDPALPRHDPRRDHYGTGFVRTDQNWTVEFRRAYILCANRAGGDSATLVIRNSSYFFGRDRLDAAAYVAWQGMTPNTLLALDAGDFSGHGAFRPWTESLRDDDSISAADKIRRIQNLLDRLDDTDGQIRLWLSGRAGADHLKEFTAHLLSRQPAQPPFYLAETDAHLPPWFPRHSVPAGNDTIRALTARAAGHPMTDPDLETIFNGSSGGTKGPVLLSSATGDLPVRPAPRISL